MSKNTAAAVRLDAFDARLTRLETGIDRLLAAVEGKVAAPAAAPKASKGKAKASKAAPQVTAKATDAPVRHLVRRNQQDFKRVHAWARGLSVNEIARRVAAGEHTLEAGWAIGERRAEVAASATPVERKASKKGKKAKARKVVAEVVADAPAKVARPVSENHVAHNAPRRANGTIAPKAEWATREALADTGKFDRFEIDAIVASGVRV